MSYTVAPPESIFRKNEEIIPTELSEIKFDKIKPKIIKKSQSRKNLENFKTFFKTKKKCNKRKTKNNTTSCESDTDNNIISENNKILKNLFDYYKKKLMNKIENIKDDETVEKIAEYIKILENIYTNCTTNNRQKQGQISNNRYRQGQGQGYNTSYRQGYTRPNTRYNPNYYRQRGGGQGYSSPYYNNFYRKQVQQVHQSRGNTIPNPFTYKLLLEKIILESKNKNVNLNKEIIDNILLKENNNPIESIKRIFAIPGSNFVAIFKDIIDKINFSDNNTCK
jgi:hypothetical protein